MDEHQCVMGERVERIEGLADDLNRKLGELIGLMQQIPDQYRRLDERINGSFRAIGEHISGVPQREREFAELQTNVRTIEVEVRQNKLAVDKKFECEELNKKDSARQTAEKAALIISSSIAVFSLIVQIVLKVFWP